MAGFKEVVSKLEDNGKSAVFMNNIKGFQKRKNNDEITCIVESGLGVKVISANAVLFTIVIDKDEFERICNEVDSDSTESAKQSEAEQ